MNRYNQEALQYCKIFKGEEDPPKQQTQYEGLIWLCERNTVETITFRGFETQNHLAEFQNWMAAYINKWDFSWPETFRKYFADDPDALKLLLKRYG